MGLSCSFSIGGDVGPELDLTMVCVLLRLWFVRSCIASCYRVARYLIALEAQTGNRPFALYIGLNFAHEFVVRSLSIRVETALHRIRVRVFVLSRSSNIRGSFTSVAVLPFRRSQGCVFSCGRLLCRSYRWRLQQFRRPSLPQ